MIYLWKKIIFSSYFKNIMAEINTTNSSKKGISFVTKKSTKVDLTPMVDLGFLLITFFMFATSLAQPKAVKLRMPISDGAPTPTDREKVLVIIADSNNVFYAYEPTMEQYKMKKFITQKDLRNFILYKKKKVAAYDPTHPYVMSSLKFTSRATYNSLVDEMKINDIDNFIVDKITIKEKALMN
jgi:biopolymer transport protein ExbD